jgi:hypothetical protein
MIRLQLYLAGVFAKENILAYLARVARVNVTELFLFDALP